MPLKPTSNRRKLIAIVGPTAVGKSAWAVELAKSINGVVISADSRQVYKGLDILTAKTSPSDMQGVPHYMLDIVDVGDSFSVTDYQQQVYRIIDQLPNDVTPILVGGTGLYISAVCDGYNFLDTKPNPELRKELEKLELDELQKRLLAIEPDTTVDIKNPRRIIRALEILQSGKKRQNSKTPRYSCLKIGILRSNEEIKTNITNRIKNMDINKLLLEVRGLGSQHDIVGNTLSTYYRPAVDLMGGKISREEAIEQMIKADTAYAKRQMTWFKKDPEICWIRDLEEARKEVNSFLKSTATRL